MFSPPLMFNVFISLWFISMGTLVRADLKVKFTIYCLHRSLRLSISAETLSPACANIVLRLHNIIFANVNYIESIVI